MLPIVRIAVIPTLAWLLVATVAESAAREALPGNVRAAATVTKVQSPPDRAEDLYRHALHLLRESTPEKALAALDQVLDVAPDHAQALYRRAGLVCTSGDARRCLADCDRLAVLAPKDPQVFLLCGTARQNQGRWSDALADFNQALTLAPEDPVVINQLAWLLATCPEPSCRNGRRALDLARRASERISRSEVFDSMAAAYAELGQFEVARLIQENAIDLYRQEGSDRRELAAYRQHLEAYRRKRPWRQTPAAPPPLIAAPLPAKNRKVSPFTISISATRQPDWAVKTVLEMRGKGDRAYCAPALVESKGLWYRVFTGRYQTQDQAKAAARALTARGYRQALVRYLPYSLAFADVPSEDGLLGDHGIVADEAELIGAFENAAAATAVAEMLAGDGLRLKVVGP